MGKAVRTKCNFTEMTTLKQDQNFAYVKKSEHVTFHEVMKRNLLIGMESYVVL